MTVEKTRLDQIDTLRQQAETRAQEKAAQPQKDLASLSPEEIQQTFHELHVHQIELEMQNDELRHAQAELNAAQSRYFDLYNLAPVGYCTINAQELILEANLTAASLLGKHRKALVGQPITHFILSEDQDTYYLHRQRLLGTGTPQSSELRLKRAGSVPFWAQLATTLAQDAGGAPVIRAVLIDITERKEIQAQIIASEKLAGLGTLAAGIAHELNSPLQVITGTCEGALRRIQKSPLAPDYTSHSFETINRNAWRCAEIVRSLLSYAHPSTEQFNREDINDLVKDILLLIRHQIESGSSITITTDLGCELPPLLCNRNQITQILINLLTNARDALPKGGEITIRTFYEADAQLLHLQVSDNGPGIPEETRKKIFDPFFTTKSIGKGTGLGLYIVASIVHLQGGEIKVTSRSPHGATFTMSFPLAGPNFSPDTEPTARY